MQRTFWGDGSVLYLDLGGGYNSSNYTLKSVHFTRYKLYFK